MTLYFFLDLNELAGTYVDAYSLFCYNHLILTQVFFLNPS